MQRKKWKELSAISTELSSKIFWNDHWHTLVARNLNFKAV